MQPYGAPAPEPEPATTGTVKTAVALTMATVALALIEAVLLVYMLRQSIAFDTGDSDDMQSMKTWWGIVIGVNVILAAGLSGGAVLTLRRSVAGKGMIWGFGVVSLFMRLCLGGFATLLTVIYATEEEPGDLPFPVAVFWVIIAIEVLALLTISIAMIMLMTKGASFKQPPSDGPPAGGYGAPYGPPAAPPMSGPPGPPMSGPPGSGPPDGLPNLPPTPGWPGA
ncbi:MAG: hypothetical protein ACRDT6_07850 [Micromonosporaceae bacterium]